MDRKKTKDKGKKNGFAGFLRSPAGEEMSRMMRACCTGQDASPDCCAMMRKMKAMKDAPCCKPGTDNVNFRRKK